MEVLETMTVAAETRPALTALQSMSGSKARRLGWLCYGAQFAGLLLYVVVIWIQVYLDTRRMFEVARDRFTESHRYWRLRTSLVFLIWTVLGGLAIPLGLGWAVLIPAYLWYLYRLIKGCVFYARGRVILPRAAAEDNPGTPQV